MDGARGMEGTPQKNPADLNGDQIWAEIPRNPDDHA